MNHFTKTIRLITLISALIICSFNSKAGTYYWVGGSGNWSDFANHWATSSGGTAFQSQVPSQLDDVVFDANSFTTTGRTVTQDVEAFCKSMNWTGVINTPTFSSSRPLHIYGSITLVPGMNLNLSGTLFFDATTTGNTIDMGGKSINTINFNGNGLNTGGWILQSKLTTSGYCYFNRGSLTSNSQRIEAYSFYAWADNPMNLNFTGTDTIYVQNEWRVYPTANISLTIGGAAIKFTNPNYAYFAGGNKTYSDVIINYTTTAGYYTQFEYNNTYRDIKIKAPGNQTFYFYANSTYRDISIDYSLNTSGSGVVYFSGSNTMSSLSVINGLNFTPNIQLYGANAITNLSVNAGSNLQLAANQIQTISSLIANGTCAKKINISSTSIGAAARISKTSGTINVDYVNLQDVTAQGGATFNATNTKDFGNNTGWNISSIPATTYYWIGGNGNWSDPTHWSTTSGGTGGSCGQIPTRLDNVVFDANSFNATGQSVTMDIAGECKDMTWTNATNSPSYRMNGIQLSVYGSLLFNPTMSVVSAGAMFFESKVAGNTVSTFNLPLSTIYFRGQNQSTGTWTLGSRLRTSSYIYMERGGFTSNSQQIECGSFYNWTGSPANINFTGTDTIYVNGYEWRIYPSTGTTLNMGTATIKHTVNSNNYGFFYGGNKTYNDVIINYSSYNQYYYSIEYNNTFRDVKINIAGIPNFNITGNNTIRDISINYSSPSSSIPSVTFNNTNTFRDASFTATGLISPNFYLYASNTFNSLTMGEGTNFFIGANQTQTVSNLIATGSCARRISLVSHVPGTTARISKSSGSVNADWLRLQDVTAQGGATFNTNNSLDFGNVIGWNVVGIAPTNYYWVGGTGNWNDANHWSTSSGGTATGCSTPTRADNVIFDVNSFSAANQLVTLNVSGECRSFTWNNVANMPRFNGNNLNLSVYGSFRLDPNMTFTAPSTILFESKVAGNTINTNGKTLNVVNFNGQGTTTGEWGLQNKLTTSSYLYVQGGTFRSNGHQLNLYSFSATNNRATTLDFTGTDTLTFAYQWQIGNSALINFIKAGMTITNSSNNNYYFYGGTKTYNDIVINYTSTAGYQTYFYDNNIYRDIKISANGNQSFYFNGNSVYNDITLTFNNNTGSNPNIYIYGTNTFNDVSITSQGNTGPYCYIYNNNTFNNLSFAGLGTRIYLGSSNTQTVNNLVALGSGGFPVFLQSTSINSQATISKTSGNVCLDFVWMRDIRAIGGASFNAGASSTDIGNNTGWSFTSCSGYYWVGNSGNWSDLNHWATSSGGAVKHVSLPTQFSNVYFDANSFLTTNQTVNIDVADPRCLNISWLSSLYNPTLAGSSADLNIYGSLALVSGMNQNFTGNFNFKATGTGYTINTASKTLQNANFDGASGGWLLANNISVNNQLNLSTGTLNTNGKSVNSKLFQLLGSNTRSLLLGASQITLTNGGWNADNTSNLSFNAGTSKITITGSAGNSNFFGKGLSYNNVTFTTPTSLSSTITGANTFNVLRFESGINASLEPVVQNTTALQIDGTCNRAINIQSTTGGSQATFNQTSGAVNARFVNLKDNKAQGGATFNANLSNNVGNVTGWNFTSTSTLTLTITKADVTCPSRNNGSATVSVAGGTAPYSYLWSTSETSNTIAGLIPGNYSVVVTDNNGCTSTENITIGQPPIVTASASSNSPVCPGSTLNLTSSGATTYTWTGPNGFTSTDQNPQISAITSAGSGTYTVTASNSDGCSATASTVVNATDNTNPVVVTKPATLYLDANGAATLTTTDINNGSTDNCSIASMSLSKTNFDCTNAGGVSAEVAVTYVGQTTQNTHSHGGGYNPNTNEFRYPEWAGTTIYKYTSSHSLISSFTSPQQQMMQLWMDKSSGDYYTANWGYNTITRTSGNSTVWSYNIGTTAACVTTGGNDVYALGIGSNTIKVINKATGTLISNITLPGTMYSYGGMAYSNGKIYIAGNASGFSTIPNTYRAIHVFNGTTGAYISSTSTVVDSYNMAFDGESMWISNNSSTIYGYKIAQGNSYDGAGTPVTLTVTDASGNAATGTAVVTVIDNIAPTVSNCPANITVYTEAGRTTCNQIATWTAPTATDNCNVITTVASSPTTGLTTPGATFPKGITTITYTFKDNSGNTSTCSFTVTVVDNTVPTITCPTNISGNATSASGRVVTYSAPVGTDNCSGATTARTAGLASGSTFPIGTTTVTHKVIDASGNTAECSFTVTVTGLAPVIVCPSNITVNNAAGQCGANVSFTASETTAIPASTISYSIASGSLFPVGTTEVIATATNAAGSSSCTFTVTVVDTQAPSINCPANINVNATSASGAVVTYTAPVGTDNCSGVTTIRTAGLASGSTFPIGTTTVTYTATDAAGLSTSCTFTVTVTGVAPQVVCPANITVNNTQGQCGANVNFAATESVGIPASTITYSHLSGSFFPVGTTTVTATATNAVGSSSCTFTVTVIDNEVPGGGGSVGFAAPTLALANVPEAANYSLVYSLNVPNNANWDTHAQVPYTVNNAAALASTPFSRVAYLMDLGTKWVWVSFDKLTSNLNEIGIPADYVQKMKVNNMNVFSSAGSGVTNGANIATGNVEFWSNCYGTGATNASISSGNNGLYDFNDDNNHGTDCYGSFQIHNYGLAQTIMAYNSWTTGGTGDLGIGNRTTSHPDWTFAANAPTYGVRRIYVLISGGAPALLNPTINLDANGQATLAVNQVDPGITDNCGVATKTLSKINFDCTNLGANTVTLTVTDIHGNVFNANSTVTVVDNIAPAITCPANISVFATSASGAIVNYTAPIGTDNSSCVNTTRTAGLASGSTFPIGTTTVTYTATDAAGLVASCSFTVTVTGLAPIVVCPVNITVNATDGQCGANVSFTAIETTAIPASTITYSIVPGSFFPVGTTEVIATATNAVGSSSCTFTVTVTDNQFPILNVPANIAVNTDANVCGATVTYTTPVGTDNCAVTTLQTAGLASGSVFPVGTTTNTFVATDASGNSTTNSFNVVVTDNQFPVLNVPADVTVQCNAVPAAPTVTSTDNCSTSVPTYTETRTNGNCPSNYTLTRTWSTTDASNNTTTAFQIITVQDTEAPVLSAAPTDVTVSCDAIPAPASLTATDNCDNEPAIVYNEVSTQNADVNNAGYYNYTLTRTWKATDACLNSSSRTQVIIVQDVTKPVITCPADVTVNCQDGNTSASTGVATGTDNCSPVAITQSQTSTQSADVNNAAHYNYVITRTWTATDVSGNFSECVQTITVQDITNPSITCPASVTVNCQDDNTSSATGVATAADNCSPVAITQSQTSTQSADVNNAAHYNYVITRTWTATDVAGNASSCVQTITVQDITKPVITCPASVTVNCQDDNTSSATGVATATDNCSPVAITQTQTSTQSADVNNAAHYNYVITRTWRATDVTGNFSECVQTITVQDVTNPVITCPANITVNNAAGICGAIVNYVATATDNCGPIAISYSITPYTVFIVGTTTVTATATDASGNSSSCTFTVTVIDTEVPNVITQNQTIYLDANGNATTTAASINNGSTDNCGIANITLSKTSFNCTNVGANTVTLTVTDIYGNVNTATATVTVKDNIKPIVNCSAAQTICENAAGTYAIPVLTATDNCGIISVSYVVTGVTNRTGAGYNASGAFAVGLSIVTFTVTDVNGNVNTCNYTVRINPAPIASIVTSSPDAFCNKLTLTALSTLSGPFSYAWIYANASFATTQSVELDNANADGIYSVYTTDNKGCRSLTAATYNYQKQNIISNYTILANKKIHFHDYSNVQSGSVGIMKSKGDVDFKKNSSMTGVGAFVKAPKIKVDNGASVPNQIIGIANVSLPTMQYNTTTTHGLPSYTVNPNVTITLNGNYKNLKLRKGSKVTLNGSIFGKIEIEEGAVVRFTSSILNIEELKVGKGSNYGSTYVKFSDNTSVRMSKQVKIEEDCFINPDGYQVTFYMGCDQSKKNHDDKQGNNNNDDDDDDNDYGDCKCDGDKFEVKGGNTTVNANVYALGGKIMVSGGNSCHNHGSNMSVNMNGLFIADQVESKGKHVNWNGFNCTSNVPPTYTSNDTKVTDALETDIEVKVAPNPSLTDFVLIIKSTKKDFVTIKITDVHGKLLTIINEVVPGSAISVGANYTSGYYFAEVTQGKQRKVVRLVKGN